MIVHPHDRVDGFIAGETLHIIRARDGVREAERHQITGNQLTQRTGFFGGDGQICIEATGGVYEGAGTVCCSRYQQKQALQRCGVPVEGYLEAGA